MKIIGHRGAAGLVAENTLPSFTRALDIGCRYVELDVHSVRDRVANTLVVIHDSSLDRTTNLSGPVTARTVAELARADAGNGAPVPTLQEVSAEICRWLQSRPEISTITINIELKGPATAELTAHFIADCRTDHPQLDFVVSSFDHHALIDFRSCDADTPTAPLFDKWSGQWPQIAERVGASCVNLSQRIATTKRIAAIHEAGYEVWCYTVNTRRRAGRLSRMGVDGVFTDRPDRLIEFARTTAL